MPINKQSTPPPIIGKAGRYTVFLTPSPSPSPSPSVSIPSPSVSIPSPSVSIPSPAPRPHFELKSETPKPPPPSPLKVAPPPVQPPPQQFEKLAPSHSSSSKFGFFWNAVARVQNAHSSLDGYLAEWFGLDHSKYQWALDDYYESKGMVKGENKSKELATKEQSV